MSQPPYSILRACFSVLFLRLICLCLYLTGSPYEAFHDLRSAAHSGKPGPHQDLRTGKVQVVAGEDGGEGKGGEGQGLEVIRKWEELSADSGYLCFDERSLLDKHDVMMM